MTKKIFTLDELRIMMVRKVAKHILQLIKLFMMLLTLLLKVELIMEIMLGMMFLIESSKHHMVSQY